MVASNPSKHLHRGSYAASDTYPSHAKSWLVAELPEDRHELRSQGAVYRCATPIYSSGPHDKVAARIFIMTSTDVIQEGPQSQPLASLVSTIPA